jgi:hypothetical protein
MNNYNLTDHVQGNNEVNRKTFLELENLLPQLEKYVGQKILISTGRSAKFNIKHLEQENFRCWLDVSKYSIWLKCDEMQMSKPDKNGVCGCTYFNKHIYVGEMNESGILVKLSENISQYQLEKVIDIESVKAQIIKYNEAKKIIDSIENSFPLNKDLLKYTTI